jgi:uncharacterized membrane protein YjgN (DUF898 family)
MLDAAVAYRTSSLAGAHLDLLQDERDLLRAPQKAAVSSVTIDNRASAAVPATETATPSISWVEPAENFWLLSLKNFGLTLATLGVYHFWGRAEARRHVMNSIRINGRPLDYTGTGREAFLSFVVGAIVAVSIVMVFLAMIKQAPAGAGIEGLREIRWQRLTISLPLMFLLGSVVYRKRQHILRRTWLQGQRFDLSGWAWSYAWQHFWSAFLVPVTLGWAAPWRASRLEQRKISEMHYAGQKFRSVAVMKPLYRAFAIVWFGGGLIYLGTLVVLSMFIGHEILAAVNGLTLEPLANWYVVKTGLSIVGVGLLPLLVFLMLYRKVWVEHVVSGVAFDGGHFRLVMPTMKYLWLHVSNAALVVGTLGALHPVAEARHVRFLLAHLEVVGDLDLRPA